VDSDPKTCDGAATPLRFSLIESQVLLGNGDHVDTAPDTDSPVTWGGPPPVRTQPTTWGRLKGMYR
jgi:hypothetical protein